MKLATVKHYPPSTQHIIYFKVYTLVYTPFQHDTVHCKKTDNTLILSQYDICWTGYQFKMHNIDFLDRI